MFVMVTSGQPVLTVVTVLVALTVLTVLSVRVVRWNATTDELS